MNDTTNNNANDHQRNEKEQHETKNGGSEMNQDDSDDHQMSSSSSSLVVLYNPHREVQRALSIWVNDANNLVHSTELAAFLTSTRDVAFHAGGLAVHVACLPVTLPLHLASSATNAVIGSCIHVATSSLHIIDRTLNPTNGQDTASSSSPIDGIVNDVVPLVCRAANQIKDEVGGICLGLLSPFWGNNNSTQPEHQTTSAGESSSEQQNFLDRLRLDYPTAVEETLDAATQKTNSGLSTSKYLLRVVDLAIDADDGRRLFYIDLSPHCACEANTKNALDSLRMYGIALVASNDSTNNIGHLIPHFIRKPRVHWKMEASTARLLQKKESVSLDKWLALLQANVLVWSGKLVDGDCDGDNNNAPLFLSRAIVPGSPKQILDLLWDNSRTNEYNHYCMGRTTQVEIEKDTQNGRGAKVVRSQTKVPFTGFTIEMSTLMHAQEIPGIGYMIVSRSLKTGAAGVHFDEQSIKMSTSTTTTTTTSELVWGVNVMRSVPGMPDHCDLTSVSQINSTVVPNFLKFRVGLNAVSDCFQALRNRNRNRNGNQ